MSGLFTHNELSPLEAYKEVMWFAAQRGESALRLALHAAVPQGLRPELLHLLRLNFVPESMDQPALESDVLFASFCEDLGGGYFRFDRNARLQLLSQLDPTYEADSRPRSQQVAGFLLAYIEHQSEDVASDNDVFYSTYLDVERWVALAFFDPDAAAKQLAAVVKQSSENKTVAVRMRIGSLVPALATPLAGYCELLAYTAGLEALKSGDARGARDLLEPLGDREILVGSITLQSPRRVLDELRTLAEPIEQTSEETSSQNIADDAASASGKVLILSEEGTTTSAIKLGQLIERHLSTPLGVIQYSIQLQEIASFNELIGEASSTILLIDIHRFSSKGKDILEHFESKIEEKMNYNDRVLLVFCDRSPRHVRNKFELRGNALQLSDVNWDEDCAVLLRHLDEMRSMSRFTKPQQRSVGTASASPEGRKKLRRIDRKLTAFISYANTYASSVWVETLAKKVLPRARIYAECYHEYPIIGGQLAGELRRRIEAAQILIFVISKEFIERAGTQGEWAVALNRLRKEDGSPVDDGLIRNDRLPLVYLFAMDQFGREWLEASNETRDVAYADVDRYAFMVDKDLGAYPRDARAFEQFLKDIEEKLAALGLTTDAEKY